MTKRPLLPALLVCTMSAFAMSTTATLGGDFDVVVKDRAVVQRCIMNKAARNIAVGMPGGFNFSFAPVRCGWRIFGVAIFWFCDRKQPVAVVQGQHSWHETSCRVS